jgi:hypothetical protein
MKPRHAAAVIAVLVVALVVAISLIPSRRYYLINENPAHGDLNVSMNQVGPFATLESCNKAGELLTEGFARAERDTSAVDVRGFMVCVASR